MGFVLKAALSLIVLLYINDINSVRITDEPNTATTKTNYADGIETTTTYRVSAPKPRQTSNRVPAYLQDIHAGYVDDDADDVIHVIEPPQYFELLKMLVQQRMLPDVDAKQPQQLTIDTPKQHTQQHLNDQTHAATNARHAEMGGATMYIPPKFINRAAGLGPPKGIPLEILASVRQRERFVQKGNRPPGMSLARERLKTQKLQTYIMDQGYARQQFERGQQLKYGAQVRGAQLRRKDRVRRDTGEQVYGIDSETLRHDKKNDNRFEYGKYWQLIKPKGKKSFEVVKEKHSQQYGAKNKRRAEEAKIKYLVLLEERQEQQELLPFKPYQRRKRDANTDSYQNYVLLKGNELIDHISVLLNEATYYVDDVPVAEAETETEAHNRKSSNDKWVQKWRHENQAAALIGEIEPTEKAEADNLTEVTSNVQWKQEHYLNIPQTTSNASQTIMGASHKIRNSGLVKNVRSSEAAPKCNHQTALDPMLNLQQRIQCMRQHLHKKATNANLMQRQQRYGPRMRGSNSRSISSSIKTNATRRQTSQKVPQRAAVESSDTSRQFPATSSNISSLSLLYDDVMTNIRNLLQSQNLESLENEYEQRKMHKIQLSEDDVALPHFAAPRQLIEDAQYATDFGKFNHLNKYLNELQQIVQDFVHTANASESVNELVLNTHEYTSSTTTEIPTASVETDENSWFLINGDGRIFQTPLAAKLRPSIAMFHRFPDIPHAELHLRNRTFLKEPSRQVYEIL